MCPCVRWASLPAAVLGGGRWFCLFVALGCLTTLRRVLPSDGQPVLILCLTCHGCSVRPTVGGCLRCMVALCQKESVPVKTVPLSNVLGLSLCFVVTWSWVWGHFLRISTPSAGHVTAVGRRAQSPVPRVSLCHWPSGDCQANRSAPLTLKCL